MVPQKKVWRPPKIFKAKPKPNIIRPRWRPRKNPQQNQTFKNIPKVPISFVANKIKTNSKINNLILWLLVFSVLLFIFSLAIKSKHNGNTTINNINSQQNTASSGQTSSQQTQNDPSNIQSQTSQDTQAIEINDISPKEQTILNFYKHINQQNFSELANMIDIPLRQTNWYQTHFNANRLTKFLSNISNNTIYITNLKQIPNTWWKSPKYEYQIKYKLKSDNILLTETRNTIVVYKNDKYLIWSIMCVNQWCSQWPFFNPAKHWIK